MLMCLDSVRRKLFARDTGYFIAFRTHVASLLMKRMWQVVTRWISAGIVSYEIFEDCHLEVKGEWIVANLEQQMQ
jgi:hypothetical protein